MPAPNSSTERVRSLEWVEAQLALPFSEREGPITNTVSLEAQLVTIRFLAAQP